MAAEFYISVLTAAGTEKRLITDYLSLVYTRSVNDFDYCVFQLPDNHAAMNDLVDKCQIEVYRRNMDYGIDWYRDFVGLLRKPIDFATDSDGATTATFAAMDILGMLAWRTIAWYTGVTDRSEFTSVKAETIMKNLVKYNAGSLALASNGRIRDAVITGITTQTDAAGGNTKSWSCAPEDNLLETLQKLVSAGAGGDFALVKTAAATFEFRFYSGQLGTDRTATVVFSLANGNMTEPHYIVDYTEEKTVAIIGGEGKGADRVVVVRNSTAFNPSTNNIETFVNGSSYKTVTALEAVGDGELYDRQARPSLTFKPLQTKATAYGLHYFLGDLVSAEYRGVTTTQKIQRVTISHNDDGAEDVAVECVAI